MGLVALALAVAAVLASCTSPFELSNPGPDNGTETPAPLTSAIVDGWIVAVSVEAPGASPLAVSAAPLRVASPSDGRPWLDHELVFENTGARRVEIADTRRSAFLGPPGRPRLLAADDGCGYAPQTRRSPIEAGVCLAYRDRLALEPHTRISRTVTLFKELRGMAPLTPGTYVFVKPIRFRVATGGRHEGEVRRSVVRLVYEVERPPS